MNFKAKYDEYKNFTELSIANLLKTLNCNDILKDAMAYSLLAGGKRIRPVLFFATLEMLGVCDYKKYAPFAVALECIHTYSLVHDDLPAMDNDDFRRGQPSNHKKFGEGIAILAGDALLNIAFEVLLNATTNAQELEAAKTLSSCSGYFGMISGQAYDLEYENKVISTEQAADVLNTIDKLKTGKLLTAPFVMAAQISGLKNISVFESLGELTGRLFQYTDDLLDEYGKFDLVGKTLGKDQKAKKLTSVSVLGVAETRLEIERCFSSIIKILKNFDNYYFFENFYTYLKTREF